MPILDLITKAEFDKLLLDFNDLSADYNQHKEDFQEHISDYETNKLEHSNHNENIINMGTEIDELKQQVADIVVKIDNIENPPEPEIEKELYEFTIDQSESNPSSMITYSGANADYLPAAMNFSTGIFEYGSWKNAWFIKGLKPVILGYDKEILYELNPNDYSKTVNGADAPISNVNTPGNVMVGIPKVYYNIITTGNISKVYIANYKVDDDYVCWSHLDEHGNEIDYCYIGAYTGRIQNNVLRSLSGVKSQSGISSAAFINAALENNVNNSNMWNIYLYNDRILINLLLLLISKTTDTQTAFGTGYHNNGGSSVPYREDSLMNTGTMNDKGLFWGDQSGRNGVKIFGIENWWGNSWLVTNGVSSDGNGKVKYKLTYSRVDGTDIEGYHSDSSVIGYLTTASNVTDYNASYPKELSITNKECFIPRINNGASDTTYFCDWQWISAGSYVLIGAFGSRVGDGNGCGAFAISFSGYQTNGSWCESTSLSCK